MSKPTLGVINTKLENLTNQVVEGFRGVHSRQDRTNGNVSDNTDYRLKNEDLLDSLKKDRDNKIKQYGDLVWKLAVLGGAAAAGIPQVYNLIA